jgi:hypothetical protein
MSSIYFSLQSQIDANILLKKIDYLIQRHKKENSILQITIKDIAYDDNTAIPKLEYKGQEHE